MRARFPLILLACSLGPPALADTKLDPDPAFLAKARTAATATVEPHYDLVSEKVPFWARFLICAGQLTAARDEGRALPAPKDTLDRLIAEYRALAAELIAYRRKADAKAPATDADAEIVKIRTGAMEFLPGDVTKLGVETMKKRAGERLAFCQLTRDWYEVQNGLRQAASAGDQQKLQKVHDEAMQKIADEAPKPPKVREWGPMPPAIRPKTIQPEARPAAPSAPRPTGPEAEPIPTGVVTVPDAGTPAGGTNASDTRVGNDLADANTRADFLGRPLWSALAECSARVDFIESKTGQSGRLQSNAYVRSAAYLLWGERQGGNGNQLVLAERARLAPRVKAMWDRYRQTNNGQIPFARWGLICWEIDKYAAARGKAIYAAKKQQADREYQEAMRRFNETSSSGQSSSSGGGYASSGGNSSLDAAAAASRAEHQRNMDTFKRDTDRIKQEIRAIDRKYR